MPRSQVYITQIFLPEKEILSNFKEELCGCRNAGEENIIICRGNVISNVQQSNFKTPLSCSMLATTREANDEVSESIDSLLTKIWQ